MAYLVSRALALRLRHGQRAKNTPRTLLLEAVNGWGERADVRRRGRGGEGRGGVERPCLRRTYIMTSGRVPAGWKCNPICMRVASQDELFSPYISGLEV